MNKLILLISLLLILSTLQSKGQTGFHIQASTGLGFNSQITLNNKKLKSAYASILDLNATYQFRLFKKIHTEVGLGGRYIFASGKLGELPFKAHTLKMQMPLNFIYLVNQKWSVASGLMLRNTKEVLDSDFREKYFWRLGLTGEGRFAYTPKWSFTIGASYELRDIPNGYFVDDPKMALLFGARRRL